MMYDTWALETIPNLDAKFSFLLYKFCTDVPAPARVQLFSCMVFEHAGINHNNQPVPCYAGQLAKKILLNVFKINGQADGVMKKLQLFLQKYSMLTKREGWDHLSRDVEFVGPADVLLMCELEYQLAVHVQDSTAMGGMSTSKHHCSGNRILMGGSGRRPMRLILCWI
jgi:hypothetical protein